MITIAMKYIVTLQLAAVWLPMVANGAYCPPAHLTYPCECANDLVYCGHYETINLTNVFRTMANYLGNDSRDYMILDVVNVSVTALEAQAFGGLRFRRVYLRNMAALTRVDPMAFAGLGPYTEELTVEGVNGLLTDQTIQDFINAVGLLTNLTALYMDCRQLSAYPSPGFSNPLLLDIDFNFNRWSGGALRRVPSLGFARQNQLTDIDITGQSLDYIEANAFTFEANSDHVLHVFLDDNRLNATSFDHRVFNQTNRPIELFLGNNSIEYLDQSIWQPFFAANLLNKLDVSNNPLVIDCRMAWMVDNPSVHLLDQIMGGETPDGKHVIFLDHNDFVGCNGPL